MSKQLHGVWSNKHKTISVFVPYIEFEQGGYVVIYCPPLNLSGYGKTVEEAKQSFSITLDEYFTYTTHKGTLAQDLEKHGWKIKKKDLSRSPVPPDLTYSLNNNPEFRKIFDTFDFKKGSTQVAMPVC